MQSIRRIDVYRLAEKPGAPLALTEEEFAARSTLVGSVTFEQIQTAGDTLTYRDTLELGGQPTRLRYALRYVNASGQRAAFSNFLTIEPAARIAQAPTLSPQAKLAEDAVTITWQPPAANIDGSTPVNLLGYNVYRLDESQNEPSQAPINSALVSSTEYADKSFQVWQHLSLLRSLSFTRNGRRAGREPQFELSRSPGSRRLCAGSA